MLHHLYNSDETQPSQTKALIVAVLALGALATPHTDVAEELMARAKYEAVLFDDTVSLPMIQFSLLMAEYQTSMGRPNLTYLMLGNASRKAFALGLHREAANSLTRSEDAEKCRTTLWCLYFMESWYSMMVGRESMMKMSDISSPFPENQPFIVTLSRLAYIGEQCSKTIYNTHRYDSLRKLFVAAEDIHAQLRDFANKHGIGSAGLDNNGLPSGGEHPLKLLLHNLYYHTILLTFRPFLVADYALASSPSQDAASAMWLRQACRQATNTAQDCIMYCYSQLQKDEVTRTSRYHGFFLESSCAVLFFDILRHPSKYAYNIEFIQMAIASVNLMIDDEPVTNARNSLKKILRVVEETISKQKIAGTTTATTSGLPAFTDPLLQTAPNPSSLASPVSSFMNGGGQDHTQHHRHHHHQRQLQQHQQQQQQQQQYGTIQFPSLHAPPSSANQLIYFSDLPGSLGSGNTTDTSMGNTPLGMTGTGLGGGGGTDADAFGGAGGEGLDPLTHFHYDVLTTDLFSFFPLNMTPPSANGSTDAAAAGMGECPLGNGSPGT